MFDCAWLYNHIVYFLMIGLYDSIVLITALARPFYMDGYMGQMMYGDVGIGRTDHQLVLDW